VSIILAAWQSSHRLRLSNPSDHVGIEELNNLQTFCFVIPCFNEEDVEAMGTRGDYKIVLVNDASTDRTLG
jgi:hypothetical protein